MLRGPTCSAASASAFVNAPRADFDKLLSSFDASLVDRIYRICRHGKVLGPAGCCAKKQAAGRHILSSGDRTVRKVRTARVISLRAKQLRAPRHAVRSDFLSRTRPVYPEVSCTLTVLMPREVRAATKWAPPERFRPVHAVEEHLVQCTGSRLVLDLLCGQSVHTFRALRGAPPPHHYSATGLPDEGPRSCVRNMVAT
eukprot:366565-Chlamydomonas_euryale.AAC.22